jgi:hypothetical protein
MSQNNDYYNVLAFIIDLYGLNVSNFNCLSKLQECILDNLNNQLHFESEQKEQKEQKQDKKHHSPYTSRAIKSLFR